MLAFREKEILKDSDNISHKEAIKKQRVSTKNIVLNKTENTYLQWMNYIKDI